MSNGTAPVCPVSYGQPTQRRLQPPHVKTPIIPPAHTLSDVITTINRMNTVIQNITRGAPQINNVHPLGEVGQPAPEAPPAPMYGRVTWREKDRSYATQKVINPDDKTQFVEIRTLARVTWEKSSTGNTLVYTSGS